MTAGARGRTFRVLTSALYRLGAAHALATLAGHVALGTRAGIGRSEPAFPILVYHRVNDQRDPFFPATPTDVFERQMAHVARTYRVLPVEELVTKVRHGTFPRRGLAITFDDGYRDTLTHAAPILARYELPATVFLATGFIGTGRVPWFDELALALKLTTAPEVTLPSGERMALDGTAARLSVLERALRDLKQLPDEECQRKLDAMLGALGPTVQRDLKDLMLTWDDVHALTGLGFRVGAHTVSHPILSRVSPERAREEIEESRAAVEGVLGEPPRAFAYPNGTPVDYSETIKHLVREAGFTCAVTTRFGVNTRRTSPWELRRGGPWEEHLPTFAIKLAWYRMVRPA